MREKPPAIKDSAPTLLPQTIAHGSGAHNGWLCGYTLNLTGSAAVDVAGTDATTINAAAATGPVEFTGTAAAYTYAGSATAADTLRVNAGQTVTNITNTETITLNGGTTVTVAAADATNVTVTDDAAANNDVITLANGADTVNLGAGFDLVSVGGGATNRVVMAVNNLNSNGVLGGGDDDTITGGAGVDTLALTDDNNNATDAQFVGVSGFEVLELQGNTNAVLDTNAMTDTVNALPVQGIQTINGASGADVGNQAFDNAITLEEQRDGVPACQRCQHRRGAGGGCAASGGGSVAGVLTA